MRPIKERIFICFILCLFGGELFAQDSFKSLEDSVITYFSKIDRYKTYDENDTVNKTMQFFLLEILKQKKSFSYPFDSLSTKISIIDSPDEQFRIFTWNILSNRGEYENFGYLQVYDKDKDYYKYYPLIDKADLLTNPTETTVMPSNWYGAIYYQIIKKEYKNNTCYVLLGWDGNSLFSNRKIIDVFSLDNNIPQFGKAVFSIEKTFKKRIVFEYSSKANMALDYIKKKDIIVFDHLSPSRPIYTGKYEFYGPDFSYDALFYEDGIWVYKQDIDIRNNKPQKN